MATARAKISLSEMGIEELRPRRAVNGGLLLEVGGPEGQKARVLATRMGEILEGTGTKVTQSTKDCGVTSEEARGITPCEVGTTLAKAGGCLATEVKAEDIRPSPSYLDSLWVRCPHSQRPAMSWRPGVSWWAEVSAKVEVLAPRKLQCYMCLEFGHARQCCPNNVDRSALCFRCRAGDHSEKLCKTLAHKCPVCANLGRPAEHRLGGGQARSPAAKPSTGQGPTAEGPEEWSL
ncbi:PREDICTED: uncharacterized protein LOC108552173 [Eufriesea mexicana]|uniref:uncharacterized protein LOC108552173 n=1 Tax=Eufriesea mexicana TaxID=516756 RepID=UPI00083C8352|nr:PREDICTED: uncharacterized protein LOC108552173 [Eufriesea mexicana]